MQTEEQVTNLIAIVRNGAARTYHQLGWVAQEQRRFADAEQAYRQALELWLEFDDRHGAASAYHQLGRVAQEQRRFADAEQAYRQALELWLEFDDRHGAASTYHQLGRVAQEQRRFADAEQAYRQALELWLEFDDRHGAASTYHQLGVVAQEQRRFAEAVTYLACAAANWYASTGQWPSETIAVNKQARGCLDIDHYQHLLVETVPADLINDLQTIIDQTDA